MTRRRVALAVAGAALFALARPGAGQTAAAEPLPIPRLAGAVALDGRVDEAAWEAVAPLPVVTYQPTAGAAPSERTEIRVAHDGEFLYASARMYDRDPRGVRGNTLQRDRWSGDDTFELLLDTYNDNESAVKFLVNPLGGRMDEAISGDAEGAGAFNTGWNTFWDAATTRTAEGWFVELRIPFSSLRFRDRDGRVEMGLTAFRYLARRSEVAAFPALPADRRIAQFKPSLARDVVLEGVRSRRPAYLAPYVLAGQSRVARLNEGATGWETERSPARDVGLDLKYGLSRDLTLDVTVNTDFAQVESDDEQVNLSRYALTQAELRPFFQERSGLFEFNLGGNTGLFYSRRIGLADDGTPLRILGGARVVGRVGPWDAAALALRTGGSGQAPGESFGVLRARRAVLNATSYAGGMMTTRLGPDGAYNVGLGLDATLNPTGAEYLSVQWAQTLADGADARPDRSGRARLRWERRTRRGLIYDADLQWAARDFDPGVGFVTLRDFHRVGGRLAYGWLPSASPFRAVTLNLWTHAVGRNADGVWDNTHWRPELRVETRSGGTAMLGVSNIQEDLLEPFTLPDGSQVAAGFHRATRVSGWWEPSGGSLLRTAAGFDVGAFYGRGSRHLAWVRPTWNVSPHLELSGRYEFNSLRMGDGGFDAHLGQLRARAALDTRLSASALVQYSSLRDLVTANLRVRYALRDGNDLYVVLNEGMNTDREDVSESPARPFSAGRTLLLKYTHTFRG